MRSTLFLGFFAVMSSSVLAAPVDFTTPIKGLDGKPAQECKEAAEDGKTCKKTGAVTIGEVAAAALSIPDKTASAIDQVKRGRLVYAVVDGKAVDITNEQGTMIKDQVAKLGVSPVWVLQVVQAIDPAAAK